jgi:hypothetical protein
MNINIKTFLQLLIYFSIITLFPVIAQGKAALVEGIVLTAEGPLENAKVLAYPDYASLTAGINGYESVEGEKPGQFRLELPTGTYYLIAGGVLNGTKMFSYHGLNPVSISEEYRWLPFFAVESVSATYEDGPQGIGGTVMYKGQPLAGGVVSVMAVSGSTWNRDNLS